MDASTGNELNRIAKKFGLVWRCQSRLVVFTIDPQLKANTEQFLRLMLVNPKVTIQFGLPTVRNAARRGELELLVKKSLEERSRFG